MRRKEFLPARPAGATQNVESLQTVDYSAPLTKKAVIVVISHTGFGSAYVVQRAGVVLGRQRDCDFVIKDPLLSRRHCLITADVRGDFFLEDLNSTNATVLNSRKLRKKTRLRHGDRIVMGTTALYFYIEEKPARK